MKKLFHGACYYPELWPESDLDRDIEEMKRVGLNFVRLGEFSWSTIEPHEGKVSLDFFLRVLDRLHAAGLGVVYCTPTPTPPIWLTYRHPERCFVDAEGRIMSHGARQHASYEHPVVRAACLRIVETIAAAVKNHPALIAWQIDNEFKCHVAEDFSESAVAHWHRWLAVRFNTIDRLNAEWGTDMWSQRYERFDQVPAPQRTPFLHNASLSTAYRMFCRESIADFMDAQSEMIRRYSKAPITHNLALPFSLNFERMSQSLDFISFDDYPDRNHWSSIILDNDFCRPAKPGRGHWFMETSVAHNGWLGNHEIAHPPGFLVAEAVVSFALGAEAINYWLWRQQRTGCELPHSAIMSSWFKPSLGYAQVQAVEAARKQLEPIFAQSRPAPAEVAITWSDHARAMLQTEPLGGNATHAVDFNEIISRWHRAMLNLGLQREIRFESASLTGLKVLLTPALLYVSAEFLAKAEAFVRAGGIWICGPLVGLREREHTVPVDTALGRLATLAGVEAEFSFPVTGTKSTGRVFGEDYKLSGWCSALRPIVADTVVVGTLHSELVTDLAWITERRLGSGSLVLLGAEPGGENGNSFLEKLIQHYTKKAGLAAPYISTRGTIVCPRVHDDQSSSCVLVNMDGEGGEVILPTPKTDALSNLSVPAGVLQLGKYEWRVLID